MGGVHESPELAYELDFEKVLMMEFEAGLILKLGSDRGPEFTTLEGWGCTSRVYYPGALGVHPQSWRQSLHTSLFTSPEQWGEYTNHQNWPESSISKCF